MKPIHRAAAGAGALALCACAGWTLQAPSMRLIVNGALASNDVRTIGGKAYVPLSDVARALNMTVAKRSATSYELVQAGGVGQVATKNTAKLGEELFTGKWKFQVLSVKEMDSYDTQFLPDKKTFSPKGTGDKLIAVRCRVKNGQPTRQELTFSSGSYPGNTALTDDQEHTYKPMEYDVHYDEQAPYGAYLLPGSAVDFTILFSVPKDAKPKDLVYSLMRYSERDQTERATDVRIALNE